jgi:hypothetical protein
MAERFLHRLCKTLERAPGVAEQPLQLDSLALNVEHQLMLTRPGIGRQEWLGAAHELECYLIRGGHLGLHDGTQAQGHDLSPLFARLEQLRPPLQVVDDGEELVLEIVRAGLGEHSPAKREMDDRAAIARYGRALEPLQVAQDAFANPIVEGLDQACLPATRNLDHAPAPQRAQPRQIFRGVEIRHFSGQALAQR